MYLLDTDHISLIDRGTEEGQRIIRRLAGISEEEVAVSVISYEEQTRGLLAQVGGGEPVSDTLGAANSYRYDGLENRRDRTCSQCHIDYPQHIGFLQSPWPTIRGLEHGLTAT